MNKTPKNKKRVLIVSPDPALSRLVVECFDEQRTFVSATAATGAEALSLVESFRPDAVALSMDLPDMSGFDVAAKIRQADWGKDILLLAWSGYSQSYLKQRGDMSHFDGYYDKPDVDGLIQRSAMGRSPDQ